MVACKCSELLDTHLWEKVTQLERKRELEENAVNSGNYVMPEMPVCRTLVRSRSATGIKMCYTKKLYKLSEFYK